MGCIHTTKMASTSHFEHIHLARMRSYFYIRSWRLYPLRVCLVGGWRLYCISWLCGCKLSVIVFQKKMFGEVRWVDAKTKNRDDVWLSEWANADYQIWEADTLDHRKMHCIHPGKMSSEAYLSVSTEPGWGRIFVSLMQAASTHQATKHFSFYPLS